MPLHVFDIRDIKEIRIIVHFRSSSVTTFFKISDASSEDEIFPFSDIRDSRDTNSGMEPSRNIMR
jgi:hypothetical protein